MRKILILVLGMFSFTASAQNAAEEAIILNQELQFLEDSVNNVQSISANTSETAAKTKAINEDSLEKTYFGENEEDVVNTRTSGMKRRSY
jgi:hypothetical protein